MTGEDPLSGRDAQLALPDTTLPYAGLDLDRAGGRRDDPAWVAGLAADPRAEVWSLWHDQILVAGDPPAPVTRPASVTPSASVTGPAPGAAIQDPAGLVLLGLDDRVPHFAADLSELPLADALALAGADAAADIRSLFTGLTAGQAAMLAYARGLLAWNRNQRYCGRCGSPAQPRNAGHLRACTDDGCGMLLFPRIEPAVITLVETLAPPRRVLLARHRASTAGGYSLLAGFVEIGESLEDAVRREIFEEAGIAVRDVRYLGSQPWPFPAGIMIGFHASAADESVRADGDEITEARWFTRDELREYGAASGRLGRPDSIDRVMLTAWLANDTEA
jgi:NAD+ diphosphatase